MGKFYNYAQRMNEIAHATFAEYREKSDAVKAAESRYFFLLQATLIAALMIPRRRRC